MKKGLLALLVLAAVSFADGLAFGSGDNALNFGFRLNWGDGVGVAVAWDRGMSSNDMFSMGADVNLYFWNYEVGHYERSYTYINPNFRFGFHPFGIPAVKDGAATVLSVLDPYAVAKAGLTMWSHRWENNYSNTSHSEFKVATGDWDYFFKLSLGLRWFPTEKFNVWTELGTYDFIIGIGFKF